jgi:hypothetical protein
MRNQSGPSNIAAIKTPISQEALDQLFYEARTHAAWLPEPVPVELLRKAYEPGLRRLEHGKHVVFYRPKRAGIVVSRILHQGMLPDRHILED